MIGMNLKREIDQIAKDKGIDSTEITGALEEAMRQAARKRFGQDKEIEARYNDEIGEVELFEFREVVDEITDPETQILIAEARRDYDPEVEIGDEIGVKLDTSDFGRILAQAAKQVIIQRIRDAERDNTFEEYRDREGEIVNGIVRRFEKGAIIVDLGRAEAVIPPKEQVPRESYRPGDRVRAYVVEVSKVAKGPQIILSRASIDFLTKLFEQEVPEMYEKIVSIESAAREPGGRSKIAVVSRDSDVDPVGACVGMKGSRVQAVVQELRGERIDIVPWSPDAARYVCSALSPAQVSKVIIDEQQKSMDVIVPDDQLSLAIGRRGQNVRLAVQLTGWRIDIKSETKMREIAEWLSQAVSAVDGCGDPEADLLLQQGITSLEDLAECAVEVLTALPGIDEAGAGRIKAKAAELVSVKAAADEERARREAEEDARRRAETESAVVAPAAQAASGENPQPPSGPAADRRD
ncbi:MAG: transcription termination/antitermination protein NusA [Spirochaetaceae bacterium]|nr:transcription termination/antitermination protein NusA [Myxococcales bacterium]MCB9722621.1 transcription termination/antitermination protein NusA [Spirochaetaceae bacterium]HPG26438.1 transcription termination factor NusA [Myxococcota bacterium]